MPVADAGRVSRHSAGGSAQSVDAASVRATAQHSEGEYMEAVEALEAFEDTVEGEEEHKGVAGIYAKVSGVEDSEEDLGFADDYVGRE